MISNNIRVGVCGNVDAGKSTLIGVLCNNVLDDGNGLARLKILKTEHERVTGRTSSVSFNYLHFPDRTCSLVDLAGHEKYLKTTLYGITGSELHYGLVIVAANMGVNKMTKEHLAILLFLRIPIIVLITKIDMCPSEVYDKTKRDITSILKNPIFRCTPQLFNDDGKIENYIKECSLGYDNIKNIIPIIPLSSKNGTNIDNLKNILNNLPTDTIKNRYENLMDHPIITLSNNNTVTVETGLQNKIETEGAIVYIEAIYNVKGIGLVVTGYVMGGKKDTSININQTLYLGPISINASNQFIELKVKSMHNTKHQNINKTLAGDHVIMAIRPDNKFKLEKKHFYKGITALTNLDDKKYLVSTITVQLKIFNNKTIIKENYNVTMHCHTIRQPVTVIKVLSPNSVGQTGQNIQVIIRLDKRPSFVKPGDIIYLRDGMTKCVGIITDINEMSNESNLSPPCINI